ncbi:MAG: capsular biosynthesis protein [Bacteroidales bacterium]|nr:capsular biosynthesis protein [Bacteroidales bacterium]
MLKKLFHPSVLKSPMDFKPFEIDMHSHLIPGIDDGVSTVEESIDMIKGLHGLGFSKLITTPHVMGDVYNNSRETIMKGLDKVRAAVEQAFIPVEIHAAAEYLLDDAFSNRLNSEKLLSFGNNYILVEMSYLMEPINLNHILFDIQTAGYRVILAHAERYRFWSRKHEKYQQMIDRGVHLQLNLLSLTGYYGKDVQKTAEWLLDNQMYSVIGTDLHNAEYLDELQKLQYNKLMHKLHKNAGNFINKNLLTS